MPKVVIFDSGFGGELFADYLEEEVPVLEVIRVIDWRNSQKIINNRKTARQVALDALRPYINKVDLIVFANYLLSTTSLKYFRRKFPHQKFTGFYFIKPRHDKAQKSLILTTKATHFSLPFQLYLNKLKTKTKIVDCDQWVELIDDGELTEDQIRQDLEKVQNFRPDFLILACTQFSDIKKQLHRVLGKRFKIEDGYRRAFNMVCHELSLRGFYKKAK